MPFIEPTTHNRRNEGLEKGPLSVLVRISALILITEEYAICSCPKMVIFNIAFRLSHAIIHYGRGFVKINFTILATTSFHLSRCYGHPEQI